LNLSISLKEKSGQFKQLSGMDNQVTVTFIRLLYRSVTFTVKIFAQILFSLRKN